MSDPVSEPVRVAMVGCGAVSRKYLAVLPALPAVRLVACADLDPARAEAVAAAHPGVRAVAADALPDALPDEVEVVLDLTVAASHTTVRRHALAAGWHAYGEKPLAGSVAEARTVLSAAAAAGRRVGCAPDTVLGTGVQTARAVLDRGDVGTPLAATACLLAAGPAERHPAPGPFYRAGAGPLHDMGPYYVSTLVTLLGPVRRVVALARTSDRVRVVRRGPNAGLRFEVSVPTHVSATLEHGSGTLSTLVTSWDATAGSRRPRIEVYGTDGTLGVPDPNGFAGPVLVRSEPDAAWTEVPPQAGYRDAGRGVGLADLAVALRTGVPHRASAELALHVLDVLDAVLEASRTGVAVDLASTCHRPAPVPLGDAAALGAGW